MSKNTKNPNNEMDDDPLWLEHLEKQLDALEFQELTQGLTEDDLREKGILGDNPNDNNLSNKKFVTEKEQLAFEPKIDFHRVNKNITFDKLQLEEYLFIKDTEPDILIASCKAKPGNIIKTGENILEKNTEGIIFYYSKIRGKVLILNNMLCMLPSDIDCKVIITISQEKIVATADLIPGFGKGKSLTVDFVKNAIFNTGITFGILDSEIENAVEKANETRGTYKNVNIAHGAEPVAGKDGFTEFDFDNSTKEYGFSILPDGRIDYRNIKNIPMAKKDERIAKIVKPKEGVKGTDIFGKPILPLAGKTTSLIAGNGTRFSDEKNEYFATIDGTIVLNGSLIEVVESYIVEGDVDYSTGNISFTGNVLVNGSVLEGFQIKAGGDVIVAKNVEASRIEAGRDIIVMGGILGKGKGLISAGRNIQGGYVQNARLEAQGDIIIKNFAVNSYIFTAKNLYVKEQRGTLIGGEAYAYMTITLKHLGSPVGTKTYVEAGTDYLLKRKIAELEVIVLFCTQNIAKIDNSLKSITLDSQKNKELLISKSDLIKKAISKKTELENRLKKVTVRKNDLQDQLFVKDTCFIKIKDNCYTDVVIKIRDKKITTDKQRSNITFLDDRSSESLAITPY